MVGLRDYFLARKSLIDDELDRVLPPASARPENVHEAMRYGVLSGGKRLRPILTLAVADVFRTPALRAVRAGCAIELIHCTSLILDDLPCMDDAHLRRGRKACHRAFGESTAILAAFGLMNAAFDLLQDLDQDGVSQRRIRELTVQLASAIGSVGLIGGQAVDLLSEKPADYTTLEFIHSHKTGALFVTAAQFGCILGGANRREKAAISQYAKNVGLAFQVQDDLLDAVGSRKRTGKDVRRDTTKPTFASICGIDGARQLSRKLVDSSISALSPIGRRCRILEAIARYSVDRDS